MNWLQILWLHGRISTEIVSINYVDTCYNDLYKNFIENAYCCRSYDSHDLLVNRMYPDVHVDKIYRNFSVEYTTWCTYIFYIFGFTILLITWKKLNPNRWPFKFFMNLWDALCLCCVSTRTCLKILHVHW